MSAEKVVYNFLDNLNIQYEITNHPPVFTIEEANAIDKLHIGHGCKNLFLKDKKGSRYFLIVLSKDKHANLKDIQKKLESTPLTFASEEKLYTYLKLTKGSVTPLGILNDIDHKVELVFDRDIINEAHLGFHPNINTATIWISFDDLQKVVQECGNQTYIIDI